MDYEPIDLSTLCNASLEVFQDAKPAGASVYNVTAEVPTGAQFFHGLPFQIGPPDASPGPLFIGFGASGALNRSPVLVEINRPARYIVFAHTLLESRLFDGGPVGEEVFRYRFHLEDSSVVEAPVRERFEVGTFPFAFGQKPFLCVSDTKNYLFERYEGSWDRAGWRHAEVQWGQPRGYYIYPWENPAPEKAIRTIELVPTDSQFIVAGITLSHLEEYPLVRSTRRPVRIDLLDDTAATAPFNLDVDVDRGVAAFPHSLPLQPFEKSAPQLPGYGAPLNPGSSPAYTWIAANPSATVRVRQGEQELGRANWGHLDAQGAVEASGLRLEIVDPGKNWVHVQVADADTGLPVPCRVAFHSPEGVPYPPHGHHAPLFSNLDTWNNDVGGDVRLGQITYAYIDGACQGWLPHGRVLVDLACGFEYQPVRKWVEIEPGQQRLTLLIQKTADMPAERWFSGDTHVHFLSAVGSLTEARGEGLNVVNLLQSQWGHLFSNTEEFTGRSLATEDGETIVYVSQENRQHMLGHLSLLGLKRPVMPWGSGGPSEAELGGGVDVTLADWADQCRAQGGTVVIPHLGVTNGEQAALIATGRADAVEMLTHHDYLHKEYYRYLNGGYRLPLAGGTDKMDGQVPVGLYRTYAYIPKEEPFNYENWCKSLRAGRTFISGGALIWLSVEGKAIGDSVVVSGGGTVEVEARAQSIFPVHCLQIVANGRVVAETSDDQGAGRLALKARYLVEEDVWLAARCAGPGYTALPHHDSWGRGIMAHTSPIYVQTGETYEVFDPQTLEYMLTLIEGNLAYIRTLRPDHGSSPISYPHGRPDHRAYLEEPFHEARAALHRQLHLRGIEH